MQIDTMTPGASVSQVTSEVVTSQPLPTNVVQPSLTPDDGGFTLTGWLFLIMFGWAIYSVVKKFL